MNALPSMVVIDFCEWLQKRVGAGDNQQEADIFELVLNQDYSGRLKRYAQEYLYEGGFIFKRLLHRFIDSDEFSRCLRHCPPFFIEEWHHVQRHNYKELRFLFHEFRHCLHCGECEDAFEKFIGRIVEAEDMRNIEGPISPERLADSTRIVLGNSGNSNEPQLMELIMMADVSLSLEIDFLDWLLLNKNKPMDLQKMPLDVFESLVDEYCSSENKYSDEKRKLIKAFKQTDPAALARKLIAALSNTQAKKMKSLGYIYDRYSSRDIPCRCLFLPLAADAEDFKSFITKYWIDLNSLSGDYLDIYYSEAEFDKSGYETRNMIKSIPQNLPSNLPCLLLWENKMGTAQMVDIKGLSHQDIFRLISSIVDMIKNKQSLNSIIERAKSMTQEINDKDRPVSFTATGNAQMNVAWGNAKIKVTQNNTTGLDNLPSLLAAVKVAIPTDMSSEDCEAVNESLEVIESEASQEKPKKSFLKTAIAGLQAIKGSAEFGAAVIALVQFIQPLIS
jgi:hypothetical protein